MPSSNKFVRITFAFLASALVATCAVGAAGAAHAKSSGATINGAGSTFVAPLVQKWVNPVSSQLGISLNYNAVGSGGGVSAITNKQADFGASDAPLSQFSPTCTSCVQIPWALAGTAVVYHLPGLKFLHMNGPTLAKIFLGKITTWNNKAIRKLNPGRSLPSTHITVVHRSDSSGTSFNFTDYLSHVSKAWKNGPGTGTSVNWPTGVGASHSSGVSATVKTTNGSIGYVDVDYAIVNTLHYFKMRNRAGVYVKPTLKGFLLAAQLDTHPAKDGSLSIVDPPATKKYRQAYPICTYTYVDVQKHSNQPAALKRLIGWAITKGQSYGPPILFQPLPKAVVKFDKNQLKKIK